MLRNEVKPQHIFVCNNHIHGSTLTNKIKGFEVANRVFLKTVSLRSLKLCMMIASV